MEVTNEVKLINVYSKLIYCVTIWGGTLDKYCKRIQVAQNRVIRTMYGLQRQDSVRMYYVNLKMLNFNQIYKLFSSLLIFKFHKIGYCKDIFTKVNEVHVRPTRAAAYDTFVITPKIKEVFNSVIYKSPVFYNSLPLHIKESQSTREFKGKLKFYLQQEA